ncbi:MAG: hypothetical protein Q9191_001209, partial [Dirinaria sp. TL-2023a]
MPMPASTSSDGFSLATAFHAACCIVLSRIYHQEQDLIVGRLVTGRSILPVPLQNVVGPCLSEIPIRISVAPCDTVASVASTLHDQFIQDAPHERLGGGQRAVEEEFSFLGQRSDFSVHDAPMLPRPRPEIYATPHVKEGKGRLVLSFEGNRRLIDESVARDVVAK